MQRRRSDERSLPSTPSFRLDGKRALVTGAGRGIGLAAAAALARCRRGCHADRAHRSGDRSARRMRFAPKAARPMRPRSTSPISRPCAILRRESGTVRYPRQQCRLQPPSAVRRGEGRGLRPHLESQRALRLLRRAGGGETAGRGEEARLDHPHLLADGPCRRRAPQRLLRQQAAMEGLTKAMAIELAPAWHPRQRAGADLHRDADDPAVLSGRDVPALGAGQDQARPARSGRGPDGRDRVSGVRRRRR